MCTFENKKGYVADFLLMIILKIERNTVMSVTFQTSETRINLMRAFAGESQARNRYNIAQAISKKAGLYVVSAAFDFTAEQERMHARVFYNHLSSLDGENIMIDNAAYPVNTSDNTLELLKAAQHNEFEEYSDVYTSFAAIARNEGYTKIAADFECIAKIEKIHSERFELFAELIENGKLFVSDVECKWMCLKCGHTVESNKAPQACPVCNHDRGYFVRFSMAPYTTPEFFTADNEIYVR